MKTTAQQKEHKGLFEKCVFHYVWRNSNTAFQKRNIMPTVNYGCSSVMAWDCCAVSGPERLAVVSPPLNDLKEQERRRNKKKRHEDFGAG